MGGVGDGVGLHPGEQVVVLFEQAGDDLARGIVGVGDEVAGFAMATMPSRASILSSKVRRSRLDHTTPWWMRMASGTAKTLAAACTSRLTAWRECPMMYSGLVFDFMMHVDTRHLTAALWHLDAVADHDTPAVDAQRLGEQAQRRPGPQRGEPVELHGGAVKVIDQLVVEAGVELQRSHQTGHAEQFGAHGEAATAVANQRKVRRRENAGRSRQIAFHQGIQSDIGPTRCWF